MNMRKKKVYKIIALIGEAGVGKDTLMQYILKKYPQYFSEIISCTTRPMREGEAEGVNYYYLTPSEFKSKISNNEMLEATSFNDWFYGTSYDSLHKDRLNIGVFNPDGVRAMVHNPNVEVIVFKVSCSAKTRLLRQLNREKNPNVDEIIRRYTADKKDFEYLNFYYVEVENNDEEDLELSAHAILTELGLIEE